MTSKLILTRALSCIDAEGFMSKKAAVVAGKQATSQKVIYSLSLRPEFEDEDRKYESVAQDIIDWVNGQKAPSEFLQKCKEALVIGDTSPESAAGYIAALPNAYRDHLQSIAGHDKVTEPMAFAGDIGRDYACNATVINYKSYDLPASSYAKVSSVDDNGFLISYSVSPNKQNKLIVPPVGGTIHVTGKIGNHKHGLPYETVIYKTKVKLINDNKI